MLYYVVAYRCPCIAWVFGYLYWLTAYSADHQVTNEYLVSQSILIAISLCASPSLGVIEILPVLVSHDPLEACYLFMWKALPYRIDGAGLEMAVYEGFEPT